MEELETSEGTEPKLGCAAWKNDDCEGRRAHGQGEGGAFGYRRGCPGSWKDDGVISDFSVAVLGKIPDLAILAESDQK